MLSFSSLLKNLFFLVVILAALPEKAAAQASAPIPFPLPKENFSLYGFATYALGEKGDTDLKSISSLSFRPLHPAGSDNSITLADPVESAWTCFAVKNTLPTDTVVMLKTGPEGRRLILYEQQAEGWKEIGRSGLAMPFSQLSDKDDKRIRISLKTNKTHLFFLRQQRHGQSNRLDIPALQTETEAIIERSNAEHYLMPITYFTFIMVGFQLAIFFFSLIKYNHQQRDKAYLWYGLFNILACVFTLADANVIILDSFLWNNLNQGDYFLFFNIAAMLAYLQFQVEMLQLKVFNPKLAKAIKIYTVLLAAAALLTVTADQLRIFPAIFNITRALSHGFFIYIIVLVLYLRKNRTGANKYLYYGTLSWIIGSSFYIPYIWLELRRYLPPLIRGNFIMGVPTVIEVLLFLKALVYRDQETEREKIRYQQQLIAQMEQNREQQLSFTADLENQVKERTEELFEQRRMMEQEREQKLRAEFEQRFSESELKALRSQINPHFIYNVLNTIESFALENNSEAASDMIQKFSRLTRLVLENSLYQVVPIEHDLEALKLYIDLEQIRFGQQFAAYIQIDPEVSEGCYCIPPMIIQPYVENAILHGLRNLSNRDGVLRIQVSLQFPHIRITVEDNGIGRKRSAALKRNDVINRTSIGMSLTQDRISLFNNLMQTDKAWVGVYDLENGTRIELKFPVQPA